MDLTRKQKLYITYACDNPLKLDAEICRDLNISHKQVSLWKRDPQFQAEMTKELDTRWKDARRMAQKKMYELAEKGNYKAVEFLMKTNGQNPTEQVQVEATVNEIKVKVEDD